jgi:hypothetical protein
MKEPILIHLFEASEGDRVLMRSREHQTHQSHSEGKRYRIVLISRATKKRLYTRSNEFYSRETGIQLSAGFSNGWLVDPTNENVEAWRLWKAECERRKEKAEAARTQAEEEKRKILREWAQSTLLDIRTTPSGEHRIAVLLERAEQYFDLRQDL